MLRRQEADITDLLQLFQWAPTLGGECYWVLIGRMLRIVLLFQWAPTLGGECYWQGAAQRTVVVRFQWAPTLGGECYSEEAGRSAVGAAKVSMGTHPWG